MKDSSESNVDNTVSNCGHSLKNVLFEDHVSVKIIREKNTNNGEFCFQPISTDELKKIIIGLDCNKSNLNGSIPANVLKDTCDTFIPYLTEIINASFQTCNFLQSIKTSRGNAVYKKKDPHNRENYRPVSVLSHVSKIIEKIVYEHINSYMEPRFSHLLCGFRKNHNTQHSLLKMLEKWKLVLDKGYNIGAIFMDLSKAFDTLNNDLLLAKLNAYGFSANSIAYSKSYLSDRYQRTNINNKNQHLEKYL